MKKPTRKSTSAKSRPASRRSRGAATVKATAPKKRSEPRVMRVFPIVGVGASAGGLEAFKALLHALPADTGQSFVFVQHTDPKHESRLVEILARETKMPVRAIADGMPAEPNTVFVMPPKHLLALLHGVFSLMPQSSERQAALPIDYFFRSLATDRGRLAVAVVLSGAGSDGTKGIGAVKEMGGIVMAQDEKSAQHDSMPRTAVASGNVDFTLDPAGIARELVQISRHSYLALRPALENARPLLTGSEADLNKLFILLRTAKSVDFSFYKDPTIRRRVLRRMALHKLEKVKDYLRLLNNNPRELDLLYNDILISVTSFFRDPTTFVALKEKILPRLVKGRSPTEALRIWVAGCSTGEEVYSLAMVLMEFIEDTKLRLPVQIFATDVSEAGLETARAGLFPASITAEVSPERLRRFFVSADGGYRIAESIRELCIFARHDVTSDPPFSRIDLVSCRNLLIYLSAQRQKRVFSIFHYALKPRGFLMLGVSETVGMQGELFTSLDKKNKIYTRAANPVSPRFELGRTTRLEHGAGGEGATAPRRPNEPAPRDPNKEADRLVLERYGPPGLLVNSKFEILQFRGNAAQFLDPSPGEASLSALRMIRKDLHHTLHGVLHKAAQTGRPARKEGVSVGLGHQRRELHLEAVPLGEGGSEPFLVLFEEAPAPRQPAASAKATGGTSAARAAVRELRKELAETKEYLQSIIEEQEATNEELKSANEEIQSTNEELQSTNEEMETAKEELQSTNEELSTVNEELQTRNVELSHANNDLGNLLSSVSIAIVMLGADLRIRRYTPTAEKILNLIPTDVGRPLAHIKTNLVTTELESWLVRVSETLAVEEHEVQTSDGHWYSLVVRPYRTSENRIEGVVIAFLDIHRLKESMAQVVDSEVYIDVLSDLVREPLVVLDKHLRVRSATRAFFDLTRLTRTEVEGRQLRDLGPALFDSPELQTLLRTALHSQGTVEDYIGKQTFPHLGARTIRFSARRMGGSAHEPQALLLSIADITPP